jgi:hypothetical protein
MSIIISNRDNLGDKKLKKDSIQFTYGYYVKIINYTLDMDYILNYR